MLILKRTHDLIVAQLRAQIADLHGVVERLQASRDAAEERQVDLVDRVIALTKPVSAQVLYPRPLAPTAIPLAEVDLDLPKEPDDIERWLEAQQPPPNSPGGEPNAS